MKGIEVKMYDAKTGELLQVYDSIAIAAYEEGISAKAIQNNLKGITKQTKEGYIFKSDQEVGLPKNHYKVRMYDANTNELLDTFSSLSEASEVTGYNRSVIWKNLIGMQKTVDKKQYIFRSDGLEYKPEHPEPYIQKGRSKDWLKKAVDVYDIETDELLKECDSVTEAANFIGVDSGRIVSHLKYKPKYKHQPTIHKKYYCKYHNE